ncbi:hypothetical protein V8C35DRAFT_290248 [Trichoderma chlorosporum]
MKRKTEKQLTRETAEHMSMVKKSRKQASLETEKALFSAASVLRFHGQLIIQPREAAVSKAMELCNGKEGQLLFFTDGAVHSASKEDKQDILHGDPPSRGSKVKLAAAVAYKHDAIESSEWAVKSFSVPPGGRHYYLEAEKAGIAGALAIAISAIVDLKKKQSSAASNKVIIFTDCQDAIGQLQKLQKHTGKKAGDGSLTGKLITRSQYLHHLGVSLEVHWVPSRHPAITGNILADNEARRTSKSNVNVYEWQLVQVDLQPYKAEHVP